VRKAEKILCFIKEAKLKRYCVLLKKQKLAHSFLCFFRQILIVKIMLKLMNYNLLDLDRIFFNFNFQMCKFIMFLSKYS